jgi:hypothetical protein
MRITTKQADAIRSHVVAKGTVTIRASDGALVDIDYQDMRTLLRLGLAVVESGVLLNSTSSINRLQALVAELKTEEAR